MDLVSLAKEAVQNVAEHAASYRFGQTTLRYLDRALGTIEKCARWAVPPPLDQDERPQPELVRPLPWVFFLALLVALRITRESISLINLVLGKPPLRSAEVVTYIQGKRRYLRTLKYQGNRMMRARSETAPRQSWFSSIQSLLEFTMCLRRHPQHYGNNNTTRLSNNDEVLVVKRSKSGGHEVSPVASSSETTMERLIEKIMVDLDADSDEDSSYTLTNVTSIKSDQSGYNSGSDQETAVQIEASTSNTTFFEQEHDMKKCNLSNQNDISFNPDTSVEGYSTLENNITTSTPEKSNISSDVKNTTSNEKSFKENGIASGMDALKNFIQSEMASSQKNEQTPKKQKIGNGRTVTSPHSKERFKISTEEEVY